MLRDAFLTTGGPESLSLSLSSRLLQFASLAAGEKSFRLYKRGCAHSVHTLTAMPRKTQSRTVQRPSADTTVGERRIRIRAIVEASSYLMRRGVITKGSMVKLSTARLLGAAAAAAVAVLRAKKIMQDFWP